MTDADYADDLVVLANTPTSDTEQAAKGIGFYMNSDETKFMYFKQEGAICTLCGKPLQLVNQLTYLSSNVSSTESNVNIWKLIFEAVAISVLLYRCTTWTLKYAWMKS